MMVGVKLDTVIIAGAARAIVKAIGMEVENRARESNGDAPAYGLEQFQKLLDEEGISSIKINKMLEERMRYTS